MSKSLIQETTTSDQGREEGLQHNTMARSGFNRHTAVACAESGDFESTVRYVEMAIFLALRDRKTSGSKSRALLCLVTRADHRLFFPELFFLVLMALRNEQGLHYVALVRLNSVETEVTKALPAIISRQTEGEGVFFVNPPFRRG